MPKSKHHKKPRKTPFPPRRPTTELPWWKRHWKGVAAVAGTVAAIIGFASALATFVPRLTVDPGGPTDPSNPYPIPFLIANTGIIPLSDVQPMLGVCTLAFSDPHNFPPCDKVQSFFAYIPWHTNTLALDERYTIYLDDLFKGDKKFGGADISIRVEFYPWFLATWPFRSGKEFRFRTSLIDGKLFWRAVPKGK